MINYSKTIEKDILERNDKDVIVLKQYENKYTTLLFNNFTPEAGYEYLALYKRLGDSDTYELPLVGNALPLDTYLTNTVGQYKMQIVALGPEKKVVPFAWFQIKVESGVYDPEAETPELPEPIKSKYKELVELLEEVQGKLERGEFKGETGNGIAYCTFSNYKLTLHFTDGTEYTTTSIRGERGERGEQGVAGRDGRDGKDGSDYVITESDYNAIAEITKTKVNVPTKTSELENDSGYVKNTDYASSNDAGVIRSSGTYGVSVSSNGYLQATIKNASQYESMSANGIIGKGTLENVLADKAYASKDDIPTKVSELENDSEFITDDDLPKLSISYGTSKSSSGYLQSSTKTYEQYEGSANNIFIAKGTLENVLSGKGFITSDDVPIMSIEFNDLTPEIIENCYANNIVLLVKRDGWIYRLSGGNSNETPTLYFQSLSSTTNRYFTYYYGDQKISKAGNISIPTTQAINQLIDEKIGALEPLADALNEVIGL